MNQSGRVDIGLVDRRGVRPYAPPDLPLFITLILPGGEQKGLR
jgi:hypothetical protein